MAATTSCSTLYTVHFGTPWVRIASTYLSPASMMRATPSRECHEIGSDPDPDNEFFAIVAFFLPVNGGSISCASISNPCGSTRYSQTNEPSFCEVHQVVGIPSSAQKLPLSLNQVRTNHVQISFVIIVVKQLRPKPLHHSTILHSSSKV
jgi:hypothetical protein